MVRATYSLKGGLHVVDRAFCDLLQAWFLWYSCTTTRYYKFPTRPFFFKQAKIAWPKASLPMSQNVHSATTPATLSKFAPRHNGRPRYDQNGRRATTPLCFTIRTALQRETTLRSKNCGRITRAHSIMTSSSRKENIFSNFLNRRSTLRLQVFLQLRATFW